MQCCGCTVEEAVGCVASMIPSIFPDNCGGLRSLPTLLDQWRTCFQIILYAQKIQTPPRGTRLGQFWDPGCSPRALKPIFRADSETSNIGYAFWIRAKQNSAPLRFQLAEYEARALKSSHIRLSGLFVWCKSSKQVPLSSCPVVARAAR
jgi:hypothetical protein